MGVVTDVSPNTSTIRVVGDFGNFTPQELFDHWVKPELLVQWWPREATVDPRLGGAYTFSWPEKDWHLRGTYTAFEPAKHLGFTWMWDHDRGVSEPLQVDLTFEEIPGGTQLRIEHGPWADNEAAQTERLGVIEGWIHFGMRLAGLRKGDAT
jgi:uncharacterized protein YndB with AHSA1/START domain